MKVEWLGYEPLPTRDAGAIGKGLACYAKVPAPFHFVKWNIELFERRRG